MTKMSNGALDIARNYVAAMAKKEIDAIVSMSAENIVCSSPIGQLVGIERFQAFQEGFAKMIVNLTLLAAYGDDEQAIVVYEVETHPVPHSVAAERLTVREGKITATTVIYDATPFAAYAASVQPH
ncbi:nuclear transport factor 2 family protein [Dickeya chrysanthemi]|uniref:nuclear transport factor 2 family protein n=1 Tax=Dickeya chrysanthemi TaxID=556 RepID=UPI0025A1BFED|nr:nuclear transport factor 2 family protein [Dickeya chrysanthemi]WJM84572.1 nuclear transport factor 2 family protein [Dickeya chrysanthemi]